MPYAKTKDNRLVNEVTLGDGYPLSNDLQPLKIGGEASILGISSPLPDGSDSGLFRVDGDLDITGTLKTKLSHDLIYDFDDEVNTLAQVKIDALIDSAPAALDTLNELAAALGDDASFATTVTNSLATKVGLAGTETITGAKTFSSNTTFSGHIILDADNKIKSDTTGDYNFIEFDDDSGSPANQTLVSSVTNVALIVDGNNNGTGHFEVLKGGTDATATELFRIENDGNTVLDGDFRIQSGHKFNVAGNDVLDQTTLGSTVVNSSLTSVGTLGSLTVSGDATFDTTTLKVDSTNNRVGIGTASPEQELHIAGTGSQIYFQGNSGGSGEGIVYKDSGGNSRFALHFPASDVVSLCNRASNGTVQIRANTSTAGSGGEETVATFEDDKINFAKNVGIGTTSPDIALEINGGAGTDLDPLLRINKDVDGDGSATGILIGAVAAGYSKSGIFFENKGLGSGRGNLYFCNNSTAGTADATISDARMTIINTGEVGIGTTSPDTLLHLASSSGDVQLKIEADTDNDNELDNPQVLFAQDGGAVTGGIGLDGSNNMRIENIWSNDGADVVFHASNAEKMRITGTGNVGIGTTSPTEPLEVWSANSQAYHYPIVARNPYNNNAPNIDYGVGIKLQLDDNSENKWASIAYEADSAYGNSGDLQFYVDGATNSTPRMTLQHEGNLGIGINSPTTTLDVEGTVSYKSIGLSSSSDAFDVSGATTVTANSASGNIILGGFTGGVQGQIIHVIHRSPTNSLRFEHNEATATQPIFTSTSADKTLSGYGGMTLFCDGNNWFEIGN